MIRSDTLDYKLLSPHKEWIFAQPKLMPAVHEPGLWDHIDGLPAELSSVVTLGRILPIRGAFAAFREGTLQAGEKAYKVVVRTLAPQDNTLDKHEKSAKKTAQEVKFWRLLRHPNILQFHGHGIFIGNVLETRRGGELPSIIVPFCEDGTIAGHLVGNPGAQAVASRISSPPDFVFPDLGYCTRVGIPPYGRYHPRRYETWEHSHPII